jgi:hypothetical protein
MFQAIIHKGIKVIEGLVVGSFGIHTQNCSPIKQAGLGSHMKSQKIRSFFHLGIILLSVLLGTLIISPVLNIDIKLGALIGGILGIILNSVIFPEKRQEVFEQSKARQFERIVARQEYSLNRSFFHPTNLPITLSLIYFVLLVIVVFILEKLNIIIPSNIYLVLFVMPFLWGTSGFLMLTRNEYIDNFGRKHKGFWAIFNGILFIVFGWGSIIYATLATIFNW